MSLFSGKFYTEDFDQEMFDYIEGRGWKLEDNYSSLPRLEHRVLRYTEATDFFWTTNSQGYLGTLLTKQKFKEKIGMNNKQFTKSDLLDGMLCTSRCGYIYTVQGDRMVREGGMYITLEDIADDFTVDAGNNNLDIMKVEQPTTLFTREEPPIKSPAQIELDKLQDQIASLQEQANKLQRAL